MTKTLLLSVKPEQLVHILNGSATLLLNKNIPKDYKGWVYLYCNKNEVLEKSFLGYRNINRTSWYSQGVGRDISGNVVARFWFDQYETYEYRDVSYPEGYENYDGNFIDTTQEVYGYPLFAKEQNALCLSYYTIEKYGNKKPLYAWRIKELEIFDKPMLLNDFYFRKRDDYSTRKIYSYSEFTVEAAPKNYQHVYVYER